MGIPEVQADLLYATGFFCLDPAAWFEVGGRSYLLINDLEVNRARRQARVGTILPLSRYYGLLRGHGVSEPDPGQALVLALRERGVRQADVPLTFPFGIARRLRAAGIRVRPLADPFLPSRSRKTPEEIRKIQGVLRAAEAGMATGILALSRSRVAQDGTLHLGGRRLTAEALRGRIDAAIFAEGATPSHTIVAGGRQGADPHAQGKGPLKARSPIVLDLFPRSRSTGYFADITRTVVKGRAGDRILSAFLAVATAREMALGTIRAGIDGAAVHGRISDFFRKAGFPPVERGPIREGFCHATGHGLGLELHEYPSISGRRRVLEAGQVLTIEPGLYYRNLGGIRIEDVIQVTRTGCRQLTRFPVFLEIP